MRYGICFSVLIFVSNLWSGPRVDFGRDTVEFTGRILDSTLQKKVRLSGESLRYSPFNKHMRYDSTGLKIFSYKSPLTTADSLSDRERGILSDRWGVKEGVSARYLNISDLKSMGLKGIGPEEITRWIVFGRDVRSASAFRQLASELKKAGIIPQDLPKDFRPAETFAKDGYRCFSLTVFHSPGFTKYSYIVSESEEVMLWKREDFFKVRFPEYVPVPALHGSFMLKNPADSLASRKSNQYMDILHRHHDQLFQ